MTSVQIGNFFSANGRSVLGGAGGSGIDTKGMIDALVEARSIPQTQIKDKITLNDSKETKINELATLLSNLKDATNFLRNPPGVANAASNIFQFTTASVSSNTSVEGSSYVSVISAPGASLQSYTIDNITSVASAKKQSTGNFTIADGDTSIVQANPAAAGMIQAGTMTINGQAITFLAGDSLNTVVSKINQISGETGITANSVKIGTNQYRIIFTATETGEDANFDLGDPGDATPLSIVDASGVFSQLTISLINQATNAEFDFEGVAVERQSNAVDDLVSDVTFTILKETPVSTAVTATISPDRDTAKSAITNFINTYNELRVFYAKQTKVGSDGTADKDAVLLNDTTMRSIMNEVINELATITTGLSGDYTRLGDIGITFADLPESADNPFVRNVLTLNEAKLTTALNSDFTEVSNIFGFSFTTSNANLGIYSRTNALAVSDFTIDTTFLKATIQQSSEFTIADADQPVVAAVSTPTLFTAGSFTLNGVTITLATNDTLNQVVQKFNDVKDTTGIEAAVEQTGVFEYVINFTATVAGTDAAFDLNDVGLVVDPDSVLQNVTFTTTQTATDDSTTATYLDANGVTQTINVDRTLISGSSYKLAGVAGTVLEGLVMVYGSGADASIDVTVSQGVADRIYNTASNAITPNTGLLALNLIAVQDSSTRYQANIDKMEQEIANFRNQLLDKFAAMERAISQVNSLLAQLSANTDARNNSSD